MFIGVLCLFKLELDELSADFSDFSVSETLARFWFKLLTNELVTIFHMERSLITIAQIQSD